ncbi:Hypothetical predicted protein [Lecanosticta acicola]|uniref:Uncharacterized protein n=1 Tax=Lecanosticta acicola TaxID=111012 RepID=A0AAI8Z603_9PEZI|nr:Hypothetical predicted protein [Lecanosticta acicola]
MDPLVAQMFADLGNERRDVVSAPEEDDRDRGRGKAPRHVRDEEEKKFAAAEAHRNRALEGAKSGNAKGEMIAKWNTPSIFGTDEIAEKMENRYSGQGHRQALEQQEQQKRDRSPGAVRPPRSQINYTHRPAPRTDPSRQRAPSPRAAGAFRFIKGARVAITGRPGTSAAKSVVAPPTPEFRDLLSSALNVNGASKTSSSSTAASRPAMPAMPTTFLAASSAASTANAIQGTHRLSNASRPTAVGASTSAGRRSHDSSAATPAVASPQLGKASVSVSSANTAPRTSSTSSGSTSAPAIPGFNALPGAFPASWNSPSTSGATPRTVPSTGKSLLDLTRSIMSKKSQSTQSTAIAPATSSPPQMASSTAQPQPAAAPRSSVSPQTAGASTSSLLTPSTTPAPATTTARPSAVPPHGTIARQRVTPATSTASLSGPRTRAVPSAARARAPSLAPSSSLEPVSASVSAPAPAPARLIAPNPPGAGVSRPPREQEIEDRVVSSLAYDAAADLTQTQAFLHKYPHGAEFINEAHRKIAEEVVDHSTDPDSADARRYIRLWGNRRDLIGIAAAARAGRYSGQSDDPLLQKVLAAAQKAREKDDAEREAAAASAASSSTVDSSSRRDSASSSGTRHSEPSPGTTEPSITERLRGMITAIFYNTDGVYLCEHQHPVPDPVRMRVNINSTESICNPLDYAAQLEAIAHEMLHRSNGGRK